MYNGITHLLTRKNYRCKESKVRGTKWGPWV